MKVGVAAYCNPSRMASAKKGSSSSRVLEKVDRKECIDDTIPLTATILTYKMVQSYVEYTIRVQRGPNPENCWDVSRRYSEFDALNQELQISGVRANLPPKKMFGNTDRQFLSERQQGLQDYLNIILKDPLLSSHLSLKKFLNPTNYSQNYHETALRNVSMFFRSNPEWSIVEPLQNIGWRINKHYYLIGSKVDAREPKKLLSWIEPGPDFCISERDLEVLLKVLVDTKHPNILSPTSATYNGTGVLITRNFYSNGSLRDKIYQSRPGQHYLAKNSVKLPHPALSISEVKRYGRQILETLQFLLEKGFVLGHIHSGNIILVDDVCKLVDLENSLMGLPNFYRTFLLDLRKVQGLEAEAVYSFGHLIYEMVCGQTLKTATMENQPSGTPAEVDPILNSLLSPTGIKTLPSIVDLLANPFFQGAIGVSGLEKPLLKVPSRLKDTLRLMRERVDARLQEDQRKTSQFRRMYKAQESLMSEEEKKKRRKKIRKQMTQEAIQEPEAYPTSQLKRQLTVPSATTNEKPPSPKSPKSPATSAAPPPPLSQPPEPRPQPPPAHSGKRGALLSSIETFSKGKLKKAETNDRSAPKI